MTPHPAGINASIPPTDATCIRRASPCAARINLTADDLRIDWTAEVICNHCEGPIDVR